MQSRSFSASLVSLFKEIQWLITYLKSLSSYVIISTISITFVGIHMYVG